MGFDAFLTLDGIPGESQDQKHAKWIEIHSYNTSIVMPIAGGRSSTGGASAGRCDHGDLRITKNLDATSPKLQLFASNGTHIKKATLDVCRATGDKQLVYQITLEDLIVSSFTSGGSAKGGESMPFEEVSLNYGKINWEYTQTDHKTGKPAGKLANWYDLVQNKGG
jgi:type VI secretion system secreted protein Hcp